MQNNPNFYAIIPANIRYCKSIKANAKLLYGEITALADKTGFCFAGNKYFAELYGVSEKQVSLWIKELIDNGFIESEVQKENGNKRFIAIHQKVMTYTPKGNDPYTPKGKDINTSIINTSIISSTYEEVEKEEEEIFCENIDEFRKNINVGQIQEKFPWKDFEKTTIDCFLHYEGKGKRIKPKNAHIVLTRWIIGNDKKKFEEEKMAFISSQRKKSFIQKNDPVEKEKEENLKKAKQAEDWILKNPQKTLEIERLAHDRAMSISKGKENIATKIFRGVFMRLVYEESEKEKIGQV